MNALYPIILRALKNSLEKKSCKSARYRQPSDVSDFIEMMGSDGHLAFYGYVASVGELIKECSLYDEDSEIKDSIVIFISLLSDEMVCPNENDVDFGWRMLDIRQSLKARDEDRFRACIEECIFYQSVGAKLCANEYTSYISSPSPETQRGYLTSREEKLTQLRNTVKASSNELVNVTLRFWDSACIDVIKVPIRGGLACDNNSSGISIAGKTSYRKSENPDKSKVDDKKNISKENAPAIKPEFTFKSGEYTITKEPDDTYHVNTSIKFVVDYPEIVHIVRCQLNSKVSPPVVNCHTEVKPNKPMRLSVVFSMSNGEDLSGYKLLIFLKYNGKCVCSCSVKMNKLNHEIADIRSGRKKNLQSKAGREVRVHSIVAGKESRAYREFINTRVNTPRLNTITRHDYSPIPYASHNSVKIPTGGVYARNGFMFGHSSQYQTGEPAKNQISDMAFEISNGYFDSRIISRIKQRGYIYDEMNFPIRIKKNEGVKLVAWALQPALGGVVSGSYDKNEIKAEQDGTLILHVTALLETNLIVGAAIWATYWLERGIEVKVEYHVNESFAIIVYDYVTQPCDYQSHRGNFYSLFHNYNSIYSQSMPSLIRKTKKSSRYRSSIIDPDAPICPQCGMELDSDCRKYNFYWTCPKCGWNEAIGVTKANT